MAMRWTAASAAVLAAATMWAGRASGAQGGRAVEIPLTVSSPDDVARRNWPVTSGVPLAQGVLADESAAALVDDAGRSVPLQTQALCRWPDGSVRWLLLDFQTDLRPGQQRSYTLRAGSGAAPRPAERPLRVRRTAGRVTIDTGPLRLVVDGKRFGLLDAVWLDGNGDGAIDLRSERVTESSEAAVRLVDAEGRTFLAGRAESVAVEQAGPLRACVRVSGHHVSKTGQWFRYVVRIHAFRGQPFVRCFYTFINDSQAALMAGLRELSLGVRLASRVADGASVVLEGRSNGPRRLYQADDRQYWLDGRPAGRRALGWAALGGRDAGAAVGFRHCWQQWPKSVEVDGAEIRLGICPQLPEGLYDGRPLSEENKLYYALRGGRHTFKVGLAKTHEFWAAFFSGPPDADRLGAFFRGVQQPLLAVCEPAYVARTGAAGPLPPADPDKYFGYDAVVERALEAHLARRERVREYGLLNWGDWYGERRVNWGNLEYDLAHGMLLQYLRTGDRRFFDRGEQAARHHIDVDVVHATNPHLKNPWGEPPQVGDIWLHCLNHTGGYYENAPLPVSRTYQMGHSTNFGHVWVNGDLDYYYLTGDRRAWEVSRQIADAMVRHMPTQYGTHIRALGWPMILTLAAYDATGDPKYLAAAGKNWEVLKANIDWRRGWVVRLAGDHCRHGDRRCYGNVPFMEGLTLCALARYHRATGDPEVLRAISVGIDQMIRECWQEDVKTFRYTACPLSSKTPYVLFMLSTEALAYEVAQTGSQSHRRILREGVRAAVEHAGAMDFGKTLGQMILFTPHGLPAL